MYKQHSRPDTAMPKSPVCKVGPWLATGHLDIEKIPTLPRTDESGSLCLNCTNNMVFAEHLLSFWESGILVCARQRVPA